MRTVLASVAALAAALASAGSALAQEDGFPFAYTHAFGETVVPEKPLRVLSLSTAGNGLAQVAGADLVGAYVTVVPTTWLEPYGPDTVLISNEVQLNFEQIAALEPDLILAIDTQRRFDLAESFATLNAIAPTVVPVEGERNDTYLVAAEALGARDAVEALIAQVDLRVATIRQSYADLGERTVAYGLASPGTFGIQVDPALASSVQLFAALGFPPPANIVADYAPPSAPPGTVLYGWETVSAIDTADLVILGLYGVTEEELIANPLFARLETYRAGRLHMVPYDLVGAIQVYGPDNANWILDQLEPLLDTLRQGD